MDHFFLWCFETTTGGCPLLCPLCLVEHTKPNGMALFDRRCLWPDTVSWSNTVCMLKTSLQFQQLVASSDAQSWVCNLSTEGLCLMTGQSDMWVALRNLFNFPSTILVDFKQSVTFLLRTHLTTFVVDKCFSQTIVNTSIFQYCRQQRLCCFQRPAVLWKNWDSLRESDLQFSSISQRTVS